MSTKKSSRNEADDTPADYVLQVPVADALYERIDLECDGDETVADWLADAARIRLALQNASLDETVEVDVDLPPKIQQRARLAMKYANAQGREFDLDEYLLNYLTVEYNWQLDEE